MCRGMVFKECFFFFYYFQTAFFIDVIDASTMPHATVCSLLQIRTVSPCLSHEFSVVIIMLFIGMSWNEIRKFRRKLKNHGSINHANSSKSFWRLLCFNYLYCKFLKPLTTLVSDNM